MNDLDYFNNTSFCPIPWTSFFIWPGGEIENCCASSNELGNFNDKKITDILTSKKYIQIKSDMINGEPPSGCHICYPSTKSITEDNFDYKRTQRYDFLESFNSFDKTIYDNVNNFEFRYADVRFRNTCNFACVYCSPGYSSLWASELKVVKKVNNEKIQELIDFFINNAHALKIMYLGGGEPLMVKENEIILKKLYEVNPDCEIRVNTNLSIIKNNKIFDLLSKFKNCKWRISVDAHEGKYNYIRYPGDWEVFYENLLFLKSIVEIHSISFSMVYTALNAKSIFDTIAFLENDGFYREQFDIFYINAGHSISALDPRSLPEQYKNEVLDILQKNKGTEERFNRHIEFIENCLQNKQYNKSSLDLFNELSILDQRRNLDSRKTFPDIYAYCN